MTFLTYNLADNTTGAILNQLGVDLDNDANALTDNTPSGTTAYVGDPSDTPNDWYYVAGVKTARPDFSTVGSWSSTTITADGVSAATFSSGLPNPTTIIVSVPIGSGLDIPSPITETSGSFSLTTTVPGDYYIMFDAFPYKQVIQKITAS